MMDHTFPHAYSSIDYHYLYVFCDIHVYAVGHYPSHIHSSIRIGMDIFFFHVVHEAFDIAPRVTKLLFHLLEPVMHYC